MTSGELSARKKKTGLNIAIFQSFFDSQNLFLFSRELLDVISPQKVCMHLEHSNIFDAKLFDMFFSLFAIFYEFTIHMQEQMWL